MSTTVSETIATQALPAPATPQNRRAEPEPGTRWQGVTRPYAKEEVQRLQGTVKVE
jgi:isocitrate lyase